jgi:GNAT superfamily N-acetyltransferase
MALHPIPDLPPPPPEVAVDPVPATDPAPLRDLLVQSGMSLELAGRVYPSSFVADADVRAFVGRLNGRPVASSLAIRSPTTSGIYAVGTLPAARRRGVGAAVTWAAIDAGRSWGCQSIVLQASEMGLPLYEKMGFRTVVRYITFNRPPVD